MCTYEIGSWSTRKIFKYQQRYCRAFTKCSLRAVCVGVATCALRKSLRREAVCGERGETEHGNNSLLYVEWVHFVRAACVGCRRGSTVHASWSECGVRRVRVSVRCVKGRQNGESPFVWVPGWFLLTMHCGARFVPGLRIRHLLSRVSCSAMIVGKFPMHTVCWWRNKACVKS